MPPTLRQPRSPSLSRLLQKRLEGAERLALLAVGSELRGDDAAGLLVADYLERVLSHAKPPSPQSKKSRLAPLQCYLPTSSRSAKILTTDHTDHTDGKSGKPVLSGFHPCAPCNPWFSSALVAASAALCLCAKPTVCVFRGHTAPENCTGAIKQFAPTHLVIVDAADLGRPPGTIAVLEPEQIAGVSFSTHQMPLSVLLDYLKTSFAFAATVIAIQPAQLTYDQPVTPAVRRAARRLAAALAATLHR